MPEVLAAADQLATFGIHTDVVCLTSADLVYRALQARRGLRPNDDTVLDRLFPADRAAPIVTGDRRPPPHAVLPGRSTARPPPAWA